MPEVGPRRSAVRRRSKRFKPEIRVRVVWATVGKISVNALEMKTTLSGKEILERVKLMKIT